MTSLEAAEFRKKLKILYGAMKMDWPEFIQIFDPKINAAHLVRFEKHGRTPLMFIDHDIVYSSSSKMSERIELITYEKELDKLRIHGLNPSNSIFSLISENSRISSRDLFEKLDILTLETL